MFDPFSNFIFDLSEHFLIEITMCTVPCSKCQIVHCCNIYPLSTQPCTNMLPPSFGTLAQICWIVQCCNWWQAVIQKMKPDSHMFSGWFSEIYICGPQDFEN
jgi:hypothetical protein